MDFTKEELEKLADGLAPQYVRDGLECETVIVALAKFALAVRAVSNITNYLGGVVPKGVRFLIGESTAVKWATESEDK
jgi:hypothetical protein